MELADPQVRNILLDESDEFRGLVKEHAGFESRLEELTSKGLPSERERIEETLLKSGYGVRAPRAGGAGIPCVLPQHRVFLTFDVRLASRTPPPHSP